MLRERSRVVVQPSPRTAVLDPLHESRLRVERTKPVSLGHVRRPSFGEGVMSAVGRRRRVCWKVLSGF